MSFVADNKGIVSRVASMVCRMSILRFWRAAVSNLRIALKFVAVSNLGVWGPRRLYFVWYSGFPVLPQRRVQSAAEKYPPANCSMGTLCKWQISGKVSATKQKSCRAHGTLLRQEFMHQKWPTQLLPSTLNYRYCCHVCAWLVKSTLVRLRGRNCSSV